MSVNGGASQIAGQNIRRITEWIWKFWWFCFYYVILPGFCATLGYYIVPVFIHGPRVAVYSAVFVAILAILIFSQFFEKYRTRPPVQDNVTLFDTYLHVMFVILLLSLILALIMPPSSNFLAAIPYSNDVLGFISFATIFHLIWTYVYRGSITEKVDSAPTPQFAAINAKFLNNWQAMVFFGTYLAQALYVQVFFAIPSVWDYALIPTAVIYLLTWQITKSERQFLREVLINGAGQFGSSKKYLNAGKGSLIDIDAASLDQNLQRYLGKIVKIGIINSFALLVQVCVTILIISPWGIQFGTVAFTVISFLIGILGVIFGKVQFCLKIQYIGGEREPADRIDKVRRAQNANSFFTVVIIGIVTVMSFVIALPWLGLILLAGIAIITYYERLGGFHSKNARFIAISLAVAFSVLISWGFLPVGWNLQLIMFPILLYFWLEGFGRKRLFNERDVKVTQNALAFVSLCAMLYYLYPAALQAYIFSTSSAIEAVANVLLICLFICGAFLTSLYQLYFFQFRGKSSRALELALLATFAGILVIILSLLNIQFSFLPTNDAFITAFATSIAIAPIFFIGFASLNKKIGSISQKALQACSYFASWVFLPPIFLLLIYVWGGIAGTCAGLLFLSIGFQALLLWTLRLHRLPEKQYKKISFVNSCFSVVVSFVFFDSLLRLVLALDLISIFLTLCITCTALGVLSFKLGIYPTSIAKWVTSGTLYFATFIVLYYSIYLLPPLLGIPYAILVIPLLTCLTVFVPHGFSRKAGILGRRAFQYLVKVNFLAIAVLVGYLPTAVSIDAILKGQEISLFMPIIYSCLLFSVIFFGFSAIGATLGIYSQAESPLYYFYNSWICTGALTILICIGVPSPFGIFLGLLIFSIIFYNLMKWSVKLGILGETTANKLTTFTSYLGLDSVFCLIFFGFALILPQGGLIFSIFSASVGTCVAIRILGDKAKLFSPTIVTLFVAGALFLFAFVVCYYSFIWIFPSAFAWILTPLFTCITLYVPVYYSAKGFDWKDETKSHVIAILGLIICACVVAIPTFVGIEIVRLGGSFPILGVLVFSFFLLYALLRLIIIDSPKSEKEHFFHTIQVLRVIFWMAVTVLTPAYIFSFFAERFANNVPIFILLFAMIFFLMNAVTLMHLRFLNVNLRMLEIGKNVFYFGFNLAGSGVITLSILKILPSYALINSVLAPIMVILPLILFFAINLLLFGPIATWLNVSLSKWKERTELGSLVGFAASMGFLVILLVPTFSIFSEIFLFIVVVSLFFPAALFYLEKSGIFVEKWTRRPELVLLFIFSMALLGLFADSFWNYGKSISVFSDNLVLLVVLLCVVLLVIANFSVNLYNQLNRQIPEMPPVLFSAKKYVIYFVASGILFVGLLFINPLATILLLPLTLGIVLRVRNENIIW
ncbi:MAG TPA: hypothetical protein VKK79_07380, partial [Candidatus Lokiarchaeia archaeon]|nr:hypothetical protein [Candidatus Lokiarchaeia archaeon]